MLIHDGVERQRVWPLVIKLQDFDRRTKQVTAAHALIQIEQLEAIVARQASEMAHLVSHLRRVKPKRPRMSATRSIWIAGKAGFKCQGERSLCPCWLLREGTFGPEGWQIDHERMWSKGYDDRESNLRALCATCHFRVTKEAILRDESGDEGGEDEG